MKHSKGFSPVWIFLCTINTERCLKLLLHTVQRNGLSPVWIRLCCSISWCRPNIFPQNGQVKRFLSATLKRSFERKKSTGFSVMTDKRNRCKQQTQQHIVLSIAIGYLTPGFSSRRPRPLRGPKDDLKDDLKHSNKLKQLKIKIFSFLDIVFSWKTWIYEVAWLKVHFFRPG